MGIKRINQCLLLWLSCTHTKQRLWECIITESIGSNLAYLLHNWRLSVLQTSSRERKKVKVGTRVFLCIRAVCDLPFCVTL